ncbi:AraC family transcriptional regulator [Saccharibacillus sacchari]|uniref:AraC family transcriptional regulator n=1 Tax=Saccharibacillus sacchari TaxID=456493 RepID=UPI00056D5202|nr:AraC family transcriptional regulator [Saccharibacillus sacchari]
MTDDPRLKPDNGFHIRWLGRSLQVSSSLAEHAHTLEVRVGKPYTFLLETPRPTIREHSGQTQKSGERFAFLVYGNEQIEPTSVPIAGLIYGAEIELNPDIAAPLMAQLRATASVSAAETLRRQIASQQLLLVLIESHPVVAADTNAEAAVRGTVDELHRRFREPVTVSELIRRSGVGRWQYGTLFRQLTGLSPLEYLNVIRLEHTRKSLLQTDDPLREIARGSGFRDEYYFSRRFSRFMGVSPTAYRQLSRRRSQSIRFAGPPTPERPARIAASGGLVGDLLALGLTPIAATLAVVHSQLCFPDELHDMIDLGIVPDSSMLGRLNPDLAIFEAEGHEWLPRVGEVCSAVSIENFVPPDERLNLIGSLTSRTEEAAAWIVLHAAALERMWHSADLQTGETAACFVLMDTRLYAMAGQGLATTLYRTGGFTPCPKIDRMIQAGVGFRHVPLDELGDYAAGRFFIMYDSDNSDVESREASRLLQSGIFHRYANRVHLLHSHWNFDDAWTRGKLVEALPELLRADALPE